MHYHLSYLLLVNQPLLQFLYHTALILCGVCIIYFFDLRRLWYVYVFWWSGVRCILPRVGRTFWLGYFICQLMGRKPLPVSSLQGAVYTTFSWGQADGDVVPEYFLAEWVRLAFWSGEIPRTPPNAGVSLPSSCSWRRFYMSMLRLTSLKPAPSFWLSIS